MRKMRALINLQNVRNMNFTDSEDKFINQISCDVKIVAL